MDLLREVLDFAFVPGRLADLLLGARSGDLSR